MSSWSLGIDTSHWVAVGLARDAEPVDSIQIEDTRAHGEALMPAVMELLGRQQLNLTDITDFVIGMGPGPFTGLRVGIVTAATLAQLANRPLRRVCSLDAIAAQWEAAPKEFLVCSDARRKELYWAHYVDGQRQGEPAVNPPEDLPKLPLAGAVPTAYLDALNLDPSGPTCLDPARLAANWRQLPEAPAEPYYLRAADATVGAGPKSAVPSNQRKLWVGR